MEYTSETEATSTAAPSPFVRHARRYFDTARRSESRRPSERDSRRRRNNGEELRYTQQPCDSSVDKSSRSHAATGRVLLVNGLKHVNCDQVFNVFCLYGNVVSVKVLRAGSVLVELDDDEAAKRCVHHLNLLPLHETGRMSVKYSKHAFIYGHSKLNKLSDGTLAMKNFWSSKLNRFTKKETQKYAGQQHTAAPSKILHFYNAPLDISGTKIHEAVSEALGRTDAIQSIVLLPKKQPGANSIFGLIEMKSLEMAAKVVLLLNHMTFMSPSYKYPFLMKLCFSKWSETRYMCSSSPVLLLSTKLRMPWLHHKCEHVMSTKELPVSRITQMENSGKPSCMIFDMTVKVIETVESTIGRPEASRSPDEETIGRPCPESGLDDRLDAWLELRANKEDQGDILPDQSVEDHDAVTPVQVAQVGPLGDA